MADAANTESAFAEDMRVAAESINNLIKGLEGLKTSLDMWEIQSQLQVETVDALKGSFARLERMYHEQAERIAQARANIR